MLTINFKYTLGGKLKFKGTKVNLRIILGKLSVKQRNRKRENDDEGLYGQIRKTGLLSQGDSPRVGANDPVSWLMTVITTTPQFTHKTLNTSFQSEGASQVSSTARNIP